MIVIRKRYLALVAGLLVLVAAIVGSIPKHYEYPPEHAIKDFPTHRQPDGITCGPTSTMLVLWSYGHAVQLDEVKGFTNTHWYGGPGKEVGMTSPDYIVKALTHYGLKATLKNDDLDEVKYEVSQDRPVIVLVRSGKKTWHYMVAIGYTETEITFSDPADGQYYTIPLENFLLAWSHDGNCAGQDFRADSIFGKTSDYMKLLLRATEIRPKTYIVISAP